MSGRSWWLAGMLLLGACAGQPAPQTVRVEVDPADADCTLRQGDQVLPLSLPGRSATVQVSAAALEVTCRRPGYEVAVVRKYSMRHNSNPGAGPLLLLLDPGTFKNDTYPAVIRVAMERS